MGIKKKAVDLLGDVIDTTTKAVKKKIKKNKPGKQDDLFPETIPTTPEATKAVNKLSAAEKRKFKKSQTDMFADELKDATEARKVKAVKKRKNAMKTKKYAEGGPVEKFGVGGEIAKGLWKGAKYVGGKIAKGTGKAGVATGKAAAGAGVKVAKKVTDAAKKKAKALIAKKKQKIIDRKKTETKVLTQQKNWSKSAAGQKYEDQGYPLPLNPKQKEVAKKHKLVGGGPVKKGIKSLLGKAKDTIEGRKVKKARDAKLAEEGKMTTKEKNKVLKRQKEKGYAHGGKVTKPSVPKESNVRTGFRGLQFPKKSIDGIAERGLTRAKHK